MDEDIIRSKINRLEARKSHLGSKIAYIDAQLQELEQRLELETRLWAGSGVYVIQCHSNFKIGMASSLGARLSQIQTSCPYNVRVVAFIPCEPEDALKLEQTLHDLYRSKNVRGEWFNLTRRDIAVIESIGAEMPNQQSIEWLAKHQIFEPNKPDQENPVYINYDRRTRELMRDLEALHSDGITLELILEHAKKDGLDERRVEEKVERLQEDGFFYVTRTGRFKLV